jgi:hypothetical protein
MEIVIFDFDVQKVLDALRKAVDVMSQNENEDTADVLSDLGYEIEIIGEENGLVTNHQFCVE